MKYLQKFFLLIVTLISILGYAQKYKVFYKMSYKQDSTEERKQIKNMLLEIDGNISKFCSYDFYKQDSIYHEYVKSNKESYKPMFDSNFFILKDNNEFTISKFYNFPPNSIIYKLNEIKNDLDWKILKETKTIGNYHSQKATLKYKGRSWTAWFTNEIPLSFGPYIFDGLPGAILYLEDSKKNYIFEFSGLRESSLDENILDDVLATNVSKKEFLKIELDYYNDPYKEMRSNGSLIEDSSGNLSKPNINQMTKEKQKYLRTYNNPIEISEAIKYKK